MIILQKLKPQLSSSFSFLLLQVCSGGTHESALRLFRSAKSKKTCQNYQRELKNLRTYDSDGTDDLEPVLISYSPVILFTEHWLFFLFLFGPLSHLEGNEKNTMSKYSPHFCIFIRCYLSWIGQITSGTVLGRDVIGSQPGVTAVCAVWPRSTTNPIS